MSSSTGPGNTGQRSNISQPTGTPGMQAGDAMQNLQYDLVSTLYHACKSNTAIQQYIRDANQVGNSDVVQFFQQIAQQDEQRAQKAQDLLNQVGSHMGGTTH